MSNEIIIRDVGYTLPNATGNFTITDTDGPGLTPKACMIVLTGATAEGTNTDHARIAIGLTDGTSAIALSWMAEDGNIAAVADTGRRRATDKILNLTGIANEGLGVGATFVSVGTNALTINVDTASLLKGWVRFFYGSNLTAKVTTLTSNPVINLTENTPSLGFQADGCIVISGRNAWNTDAGLNNAIISIGAAGRLPSISQACIGIHAADRNDPTVCGMMARSNRVASILSSSAGVVSEACSIEVTNFNADDIEFTTRTASEGIGLGVLAFSLNGERCYADCPSLNSDTTGTSSYTSAGFKARALFAVGSGAATVNTLDTSHAAMCVSVYSPLTLVAGELVAKWNAQDDQSTSNTSCAYNEQLFIRVEGHWVARVSQITGSGFDYTVSLAASADLPTFVFLIGEAATVVSDTEEITDQAVVFLNQSLALSDTEEITDTPVLVTTAGDLATIVAEEDLRLEEAVELVYALVLSETEEILENVQNPATGSIVVSDTEELTDTDLVFLGNLVIVSDVEQITDEISTPLTATAEKAAPRGTTLQAGATAGWTFQAGAERGGTLSHG